MDDWISQIQRCFETGKVLYSRHARQEMVGEELGRILEKEVHESVLSGEVIEEYPDDKPYPSRLIYGRTNSERPLHVLCAFVPEDGLAVVITVYHPDPERWIDERRRIRS